MIVQAVRFLLAVLRLRETLRLVLPRAEFTRGRMPDGISFILYASYAEATRAWAYALRTGQQIELNTSDGRRIILIAHNIVYMEPC